MKQTITKEQWDEISDKEKILLVKSAGLEKDKWFPFYIKEGFPFSIGQMIEYLGDDLEEIVCNKDKRGIVYGVGLKDGKHTKVEQELVDALWEACRYKLKQ